MVEELITMWTLCPPAALYRGVSVQESQWAQSSVCFLSIISLLQTQVHLQEPGAARHPQVLSRSILTAPDPNHAALITFCFYFQWFPGSSSSRCCLSLNRLFTPCFLKTNSPVSFTDRTEHSFMSNTHTLDSQGHPENGLISKDSLQPAGRANRRETFLCSFSGSWAANSSSCAWFLPLLFLPDHRTHLIAGGCL